MVYPADRVLTTEDTNALCRYLAVREALASS